MYQDLPHLQLVTKLREAAITLFALKGRGGQAGKNVRETAEKVPALLLQTREMRPVHSQLCLSQGSF